MSDQDSFPFMEESVTPAQKSRRRGIGDNSRKASVGQEIDLDKEVKTAATKAEEKIADLNTLHVNQGIAWQNASHEAITTVFAFIYLLHVTGADPAFRQTNRISSHGNSRNTVQPIVAHLFRKVLQKFVRSTVSKWATIIFGALSRNQTPEEFALAVRSIGIENLYEQSKPESEKETWQEVVRLAESILPGRIDAPLFADPEVVKSEPGRRLAVIECDGAGSFRMIAVLGHSPKEVIAFLAAIARKQRAQNE